MNTLEKCVFCGAVVTIIGATIYCNCGDRCRKYNPYNESYIRKPTQQYFPVYGQQFGSTWTSALTTVSGYGNGYYQ